MSNYSPRLAPAGRTSLMCELTFAPGRTPPARETEQEVLSGLVRAGLIRRGEVLFTDASVAPMAYIVYDRGHAERRRRAIEALESLGITPLGRFGRYDYDNSDQCVIKARALAGALLAEASRGAPAS
jgi:protoporphyrinogen oxidase